MKRTNSLIIVLVFSVYVFAGTVSDKDGYKYKTVKIGKQEWMAENLNYKSKSGKGKNICAGCEDFGRLYTWNSAMDIKQEAKEDYDMESRTEDRPISKKHQGICPAGWHIPTVEDMVQLFTFISVKDLKDAGEWQESFLQYVERDIHEIFFRSDGGRSRSVLQSMEAIGRYLCEPGYWANYDGKEKCNNRLGMNIKSSGSGEFRELDKCVPGQMITDFNTRKRVCCSEGCAGDHFAMWLADENTSCHDKVTKGRHSCVYAPKAVLFKFNEYGGTFLQNFSWENKNSYASVRCLKD